MMVISWELGASTVGFIVPVSCMLLQKPVMVAQAYLQTGVE